MMTDRATKVTFLAFHAAAIVAAAAFGPSRAMAGAFVVSVLALGRYLAMSLFAAWIGRSPLLSLLWGSLWLAALVALAATLFVIGRAASPALAWAAAAALAGPFAATVTTAGRALHPMLRGGTRGEAKESA